MRADDEKVAWTTRAPQPTSSGSFNPGELELYDAGEDALLLFTSLLLGLLTERSVQIEHPFYMKEFCAAVLQRLPCERFTFAPAGVGGELLRFEAAG